MTDVFLRRYANEDDAFYKECLVHLFIRPFLVRALLPKIRNTLLESNKPESINKVATRVQVALSEQCKTSVDFFTLLEKAMKLCVTKQDFPPLQLRVSLRKQALREMYGKLEKLLNRKESGFASLLESDAAYREAYDNFLCAIDVKLEGDLLSLWENAYGEKPVPWRTMLMQTVKFVRLTNTRMLQGAPRRLKKAALKLDADDLKKLDEMVITLLLPFIIEALKASREHYATICEIYADEEEEE